MSTGMGVVALILWVVWTIVALIIYHKCFTVFYSNFFNDLLKELIGGALAGILMAGLTLYFWWITVIIVIIVGIVLHKKLLTKAPIVVSIILSIVIMITGICFNASLDEDSDNNTEQAQVQMVYILEE